LFTKVNSITIQGINAINVEVQLCIAPGIPCFNIVGLPDKIVAESKERVRAAITAIGMQFPPKRITVNLSASRYIKSWQPL
jgi:magnesium chelatase family protein